MKIRSGLAPGITKLARHTNDISKQASNRLKWFDYYHANGNNARKTCRHFGISPDTFYRWLRRYDPKNLKTLEDRSHIAKHLRQPTWTPDMENMVLKLREENPRWGKQKLAELLNEEGIKMSVSMVGRMLKRLKYNGLLIEPLIHTISARKRQIARPYAIRKPKEYVAREPGDIVQVDTLDVRPLPGVKVSRWDVVAASTSATSRAAASFIDAIKDRMPFKVKAIQVDGGSEFQDVFEETCQKYGIKLFVLPPHSPKLNGCVERAQRTHTEEFYEVADMDFDIASINKALLSWEMKYNTYRPHQSLNYLTPKRYLELFHSNKKGGKVYGIA
jgi:putative transposase